MVVDGTRFDLAAFDAFGRNLEPRLLEALAALNTLTAGPGAEAPGLGDFQDAHAVAARYAQLRDAYGKRLRRLINALIAAQMVTDTVLAAYRNIEDVSVR